MLAMRFRLGPRHELQWGGDGAGRHGLDRIQDHPERRRGVNDHNRLEVDWKRREEKAGPLQLRV